MAEPRRLADDPETSPLARVLLASAAGEDPGDERRGVVAKRLGIAALLVSGTEVSSLAAGTALWWKVGLLALAFGGVTAVAIPKLATTPLSTAPELVSPVSSQPAPVRIAVHEPAPPVALVAHSAEPAPTVVSPQVGEPVRRAESRPAPTPEPSPPVAAPAAPPPVVAIDARRLAAEVAVLDRARTSLRAGDLATTVVVLEEHARDFADGALRAEAEVVWIETAIQRRDFAQARSRAQTFLASFPQSPLARRVRSLVERLPASGSSGEGENP